MDTNTISKKLKQFRKTKGITLEELSKLADLSQGHLSKIENGQRFAPVSTLQKIATALGINVNGFFEGSEENETPQSCDIVYQKNHSKLKQEGDEAYSFIPLLNKYKNKQMSPFLMILESGQKGTYSHDSEEFFFVIKGEVEFSYEGESHLFKKHDSIYFDSRKDHTFYNSTSKQTLLLSINFNYRRF